MSDLSQAIIRTLAFQAAWGYSPTRLQLFSYLDTRGEENGFSRFVSELESLSAEGLVREESGRVALSSFESQIAEGRDREFYFPRKLRKARRITAYLSKLPWIRAVFLCNTTALGQARDGGDLDFFIVAKAGAIWQTRFFSVLPFKILKSRPDADGRALDPACFSFFVADDSLDLTACMLPEDDPYFRYWFLTLLPLKADLSALEGLWSANAGIRTRHPMAKRWMALDGDLRHEGAVRKTWLESRFESLQRRSFPSAIAERMGKDSSVIVNDGVLKFHTEDRRAQFKADYHQICRQYRIEP